MIGILFNAAKLRRMEYGTEPYENIHYYLQFSRIHKTGLLFYSPELISRNRVLGYKISSVNHKLHKYSGSLPRVNLVRAILKPKDYRFLKRLEGKESITFLNLVPGRNKLGIYQYLKQHKTVSDAVPHTERLTYATLLHFLERYSKVILKPNNGSLGRRIYTIEKMQEQRYELQSTSRGHKKCRIIQGRKSLATIYRMIIKADKNYLVQPYLPFRQYQGEKFDIRTSVQKDQQGNWRVTGLVARVAGKNGIVTNVAQGGRVVSFTELQQSLPPNTKQKLCDVSVQIAKVLEELHPSIVDLGLDLALDAHHKIWFIEANYCDQRYAYRESKDLEMWKASYTTPLEYAYAVLKKGERS